MTKSINPSSKSTQYTSICDNMRGVSFTGEQTGSENGRFSYLENMYVDYEGGGECVESIPGFRELYSFGKHINGVYLQPIGDGKEYVIVHAADKLYRFEVGERDKLSSLSPIGTLNDAKSCAFTYGRDVYLLDGAGMYRISESGGFDVLGEGDFKPYVPTLYRDGEMLEDRNLLTNEGREIYNVTNHEYYGYSTPGIRYDSLDDKSYTCVVRGINDDFEGAVVIPKYYIVDGKAYRVVRIMKGAFQNNQKITALFCHEGLEYIDKRAFFNCTNLKDVRLPDSLIEIGEYAFFGCTALYRFYIGRGVQKLGIAVLGGNMQPRIFVDEYERIYEIENYEILTQFEHPDEPGSYANSIETTNIWPRVSVGFKLHYPVESIVCVKVNGVIQTEYDKNHIFLYAPVYHPDTEILEIVYMRRAGVDNTRVEIVYKMKEESFVPDEAARDVFTLPSAKSFKAGESIYGCKCSASFDGRIFLSANTSLGGTVFYSALTEEGAVDPTYFGSRSFLLDGLGDYPITSLMATDDGIVVLKSGDDGSGSIYYHTPGSTNSKYPVSGIYGSTGALGESALFFDDALFLCSRGLCSIEKSSSNSFRSVKCRSSSINLKLLQEDIRNISITKWCGYLVLCAEGKMYLADSRDVYRGDGGNEYEWYYLSGIGTYKNDSTVYRYSTAVSDGYEAHERGDEPTDKTVYSVKGADGELIYFTLEDGKKYEVYPTLQRTGGDFSAAVKVICSGELLFFFTESGDMCVFNNDMRSMAPSFISDKSDFSAEEYELAMNGKIHPFYYSFANHAPHYELQGKRDDCGLPHLTKSSVRSSLVIRCKNLTAGNLVCSVSTDFGGVTEVAKLPPSKIAFDYLDFSALSFSTDDFSVVPIDEGERGWVYKQITLCSDEFCAPIGVYSISYRYKIKGKIRKN